MTLSQGTFKFREYEDVDHLKNDHNEDEASHIQQLRQALSTEKNLKSRLDDKFLLKFLRARKFDHEKTLSLVKNYYKQKTKYPDFYKKMRCSLFPNVFAKKGLGKLPEKDTEGRSIFFATFVSEWDPTQVPVLDILACSIMALELATEDDEAQQNGFVFLMDAADFEVTHLRAFDPFIIAQIISVTWNSFPAKFKRLHIINAPGYFNVLYAMLKPFLTQKLKKRFQFHGGDLTNFYKELPREILPEEFGGHLGPIDSTEWNAKLLDNDAALERDSIYGYIDH